MNTDMPSSTIQTTAVAAAICSAFWAIYAWLNLGPPAPEVVVSAVTGAVAAISGYLQPERRYLMTPRA